MEQHWWNSQIFSIGGNGISPFDIFLVAAIIFVGLKLAGSYRKFMISKKMEERIENASTRLMLANGGKYLIVVLTGFITLETIGIDLSSLAVVAGALSVGIGFGLQNIVNNLVSGLLLMMEKSIKIGDIIELDASTIGKVEEIRLRSTIVKTFDNVEIVVPNGELVQNRIVNRTLSNGVRRLVIPFGVAYGTDIENVKQVVLNAVEKNGLNYLKDEDRKPVVRMSSMSASSVDFNLFVHIDQCGESVPLPSDFLVVIYNALNSSGISIPFPQLDVHMVRGG